MANGTLADIEMVLQSQWMEVRASTFRARFLALQMWPKFGEKGDRSARTNLKRLRMLRQMKKFYGE
jgi:hypothetical protein